MNMYEARWENAKKVGNKIKDFLDAACLVFTDEFSKVYDIIITNKEIYYTLQPGEEVKFILFVNDPDLDNGSLDSIKEWNSKFEDWRVVLPKDMLKII